MANSLQISESPTLLDFAFANYGTTDIPSGAAVIIDTGNVISVSSILDGIGVKLPTAQGQPCVGVTMEILRGTTFTGGPPGIGRVRCGGIAPCTATSTVTAGTVVDNDFAGTPGNVITHVGGKAQLGLALTASTATGDPVAVLLFAAPFNA